MSKNFNLNKYIDCCKEASLDSIKVLYRSSHEIESLLKCDNCGTYWFYRFHEYVVFLEDEEDDHTVWYSKISKKEADYILNNADLDLSFLKNKPTIMIDNNGIHKVIGQPEQPF